MSNDFEAKTRGRAPVTKRARKLALWLTIGVVLGILLAACSGTVPGTSIHVTTGSGATATTSPSTGAASTPSSTPASTSSTTTTTASATPSPSSTTTSTPPSAVTDAIKSVIQKANQEQQQALASQNSSVMQDTATTSYYNQLVQIQQQLTSQGVTAIKLDKLTWGDISLKGSNTAQATTSETWSTTLQNGSTVQETNTNVYTLVLQNGTWKIQADQQPGSGLQPASGSTSANGSGSGSTVPVDQPNANQSANWSGYYATGGTYTSVSATWTVPTVSVASSAGADATWVGIGGVSSTDLIQAGTDATAQGNQVVYQAWIETLPQVSQTVPLAVNAGDSVTTSITLQSNGLWLVTIKDNTTSKTYQTTVNYSSSESSAEWIEESPSAGRGQLPLDNFGTVNFTKATTVVNGQQETVQQAGGQAITMSNGLGQALAQASKLGSDGESFSVTRTSASSSSGLGRGNYRNYP